MEHVAMLDKNKLTLPKFLLMLKLLIFECTLKYFLLFVIAD